MVIIGSARIDENGHAHGGQAGDQKQTGKPDYRGEVSMQEFYNHSKGWIIARFVKAEHANIAAKSMVTACNNENIGYDQYQRDGIWTAGTSTKKKTECDCSSLVRRCIYEATGVDVGNIRTILMERMLKESGLFLKLTQYTPGTKLFTGDILFTGTLGHPVSGHTVIVVNGKARNEDGENVVLVAEPILRKGSKGTQVKILQRNLNTVKAKDNKGNKLDVDGDFGKLTEQAVKNFQTTAKKKGTYNDDIDGIYGKYTFSALSAELNK